MSPAPVTSYTSRATVGNSCTPPPRLKRAMPSSPHEMRTASASQRSRSRLPAAESEARSRMSMPAASAASARFGFMSEARR